MPEVDELMRRGRRAASAGDLREALRLYRAALEAGSPATEGPDDAPDLLPRIADLHLRLDEPDAARAALVPYLDAAAEGAVDPDRAGRAVRSYLAEDPHQRLAVRAARILDHAGRKDEAVDVLRQTWETRTGRRLPAGDIEKTARRLAPDVDLGSWTPEWPSEGGDRPSPARADRGIGPEGRGSDAPGRDGPVDVPRPSARDEARADGVEGDGAADEGDGGRGDAGSDERTPSRRFVRRYDRRPRGGDGPWVAENGRDDLRRGLEILEELLKLDPGDTVLRRRKVQYARRLEDSAMLEEAILELAGVLDEAGAHRGARLLYHEVLERLNPESRRAEIGLRRIEAGLRACRVTGAVTFPMRVSSQGPRDGGPPPAPEAGPAADGTSSREGVDGEFHHRLSAALDRAPRELEHLQAAGLAALGEAGGQGVPWQAHRELGRFLLLRDRPDEAARHLAAARDRAPREGDEAADVLYDLGVARRRAGRPDEARDCFRRLAERDPGFAAAWEALST